MYVYTIILKKKIEKVFQIFFQLVKTKGAIISNNISIRIIYWKNILEYVPHFPGNSKITRQTKQAVIFNGFR